MAAKTVEKRNVSLISIPIVDARERTKKEIQGN
jgi:hypothetical protein